MAGLSLGYASANPSYGRREKDVDARDDEVTDWAGADEVESSLSSGPRRDTPPRPRCPPTGPPQAWPLQRAMSEDAVWHAARVDREQAGLPRRLLFRIDRVLDGHFGQLNHKLPQPLGFLAEQFQFVTLGMGLR